MSRLAVARVPSGIESRRVKPGYCIIQEGHWVQFNGTLHPLNLELLNSPEEDTTKISSSSQSDWNPPVTQDEWFVLTPQLLFANNTNNQKVPKELHQELLFVHKPSGLHCVPPREVTQPSLATLVQSQYPTAKPCHRLDYDTSGIVLFGLTPQAHSAISQQFEQRTTSKTYLALIAGHPSEDSGTINLPIGKLPTPEGYHQWACDDGSETNLLIEPRSAMTHWTI
jgi:23S rRNA-/tRNA-specific pseudouridylate synthase